MRRVAGALACLAIAALWTPAASQTARTVKIIVPTPAGGGSDLLARQLAEEIGRAHGVTFVIENRPGGGNVIGFEAASRAEPDGNTLLLITNAFVIIPHLRKLSYDIARLPAPVASSRRRHADHRGQQRVALSHAEGLPR